MTEPTYWDDRLYLIRGDALELKRHVLSLADDLTFCTGHNAGRAIERFDEEARRIYGKVDRAGKASVRAAARQVELHPMLTALAGAAFLGLLVAGLVRAKSAH